MAVMQTKTYENLTEADLSALAADYAPLWLQPGTVVALHGDLGAGKTALVRAFIRHILGAETPVPSPTFTLVQPYETPDVTVSHYDLYRLSDASELGELNWEAATAEGLVFVEWPQRAGRALPRHHWQVEISDGHAADMRRVRIRPPMAIDTAMVLAAGFGKRLRPLTDHTPKPLLKLGGVTMLDHALHHLESAGISNVVVNAHYLADQIAAHAKNFNGGLSIEISHEMDVLETGGGVKHALPLLNADAFLTVNSDIFWRDLAGHAPAMARMLAAFDADAMDTLLLLAERDRAIGFDGPGDCFLNADGTIEWRGNAASAPYVFAGVSVAKAQSFRDFSETCFSQKKIWDRHQARGRLFALVHSGEWYHCSTPDDFAAVNAALGSAVA